MPWITGAKLAIGATAVVAVGLLVIARGKGPNEPLMAGAHPTELGYLSTKELPNSAKFLPPPPASGSPAMAQDLKAREAALKLRGSPRYALAAADADREQPRTVAAFDCAFGARIAAETAPALYQLLARVRLDVRAVSYAAKTHYKRIRPYVLNNAPVCYPPDEKLTRNDGSYPSARGAVGWAFALVLARLNPSRARQIMKRGSEFGQSRVICDEEWQSDVDAARTIAVATLQKMQGKPAFQRDMQAGRREADALIAEGANPPANCAAEGIALAAR